LQISTNNQFIVDYTIHQSPADITTMISHLMDYKSLYGFMPDSITTDKGYGSEVNYEFAEQHGITAFAGNNMTKSEKKTKKLCDPESLYYDSQGNYFICPMGQKMHMVSSSKKTTKTGYEQNVSYYQAQRCVGCPLRGVCNKGKDNKKIEINHNAWRHRRKVDKKLNSPEGVRKLIRRSYEPENVFGNIKHNKKFRRFNLRGLKNVETEIGIISLAHNISKFAKKKGA
jgi:hypothetical protein